MMKHKKYNFFNYFIIPAFLTINTQIGYSNALQHNKVNSYNINKTVKIQKFFSLLKLATVPILLGTTIFLNKKNFIRNIQKNPIISLAASCFIYSFITDSINRYYQINRTLYLLEHSKIMSHYLLYAHALKNSMRQNSTRDPNYSFKEEEFFLLVTDHLPLSFAELEQFTFDLLAQCSSNIEKLQLKTDTTIEKQMYELTKEHITLDDLLSFYQNNKNLYPYLQQALQNPVQNYNTIVLQLNTLIKKNLEYIIKQ